MKGGYVGKLLFVDLTKGTLKEKPLSEELAKNFIGGYGIGARLLYDMMKPGVDPLGPDNILGFVSGPLNGTGALFGGRYTVVCKSPVTGGWNDANSGGFFGPELKRAGYDAVFVSGASNKPVYLFIKDGKAEIRDAKQLWGKDCTETEEALIRETGESKLRVALIGPAGEKKSLMACVINDKHRAAGRGGCGAVMGSKNLKAVVVRGTGKVPVAHPEKVKEVNAQILDNMKNGPAAEMIKAFAAFGTGGNTGMSALNGDSPVKNWGGVGIVDMGEESAAKLATVSFDAKYNTQKYACANCPIGCGAHYKVEGGKWPVAETDRPEYETLAAFGTMTLNDDAESIIKCNDICNRYGLDTISVGACVAWAIECYENGIFTKKETEGIELTWGNAEAIVAITQAIADQTGFGKVLALGSAKAAEKLRKGVEYLQTVRGIELPMHDPRFSPWFAKTYQYDPTPARHVKGGLGVVDFQSPNEVKYNYEGRGPMDLGVTCGTEISNTSGLCLFGGFAMPRDAATRFIEAATGWDFKEKDVIQTGKRIMNMRHAFNLREGQRPNDDDNLLPRRCVGEPPQKEGPLKGVTVDYKKMANYFFENMGWDEETTVPTRKSLEDLGGMEDVIRDLHR
ncbi:MAG: aldehyde ferredoxin oxidoreductase family protein [Thermodesulfobacteriota bacterium]